MQKLLKSLLVLLILVGFTGVVLAQEPATAELMDVDGNVVGTATFTEGDDGVTISVTVSGLTGDEGEHGIHIHAVGACSPDFSAAGGHFNPAETEHGMDNPNGPHAGDGPNLTLDAEGNAEYEAVNDRITLGEGENSLFDEDGSALVIHAGPDDQTTDPTGESGDRIACGVIAAGEAAEDEMAEGEAAEEEMAADEMAEETGDEAEAMAEETGDEAETMAAETEEEPAGDEPDAEVPTQEAPAELPQSGGVNYTPFMLLGLGAVLLLGGAFLRKIILSA